MKLMFPGRLAPRRLRLGLTTLGLSAVLPLSALADTGDVVVAEALFRDGKELLAQEDYARACPKLSESFRRDPATGTLLALAMCHEREGKLASAWGEYAGAAARSKLEGRPDRERAARAKATEMEPRVSKLTIGMSEDGDEVADLRITRNGAPVSTALLGTALPIDGGIQVIEASAPGKKTWRAKIAMESSGDTQTVTVPELEDADDLASDAAAPKPRAGELAKGPGPASAEPAKALPHERDGIAPLQRLGIATSAVGLAGIGVGAFFAFRAMGKNDDSKAGCSGDRCLPSAKQDRLDAISAGNLATVGLVGGGAFAAAGLAMLLFGRHSGVRPAGRPGASLDAFPMASAERLGGVVRCVF